MQKLPKRQKRFQRRESCKPLVHSLILTRYLHWSSILDLILVNIYSKEKDNKTKFLSSDNENDKLMPSY